MIRHDMARLVLIAALSSAPSFVFANGMRLLSQDAFATARGEAFVATADNSSAIYYNPAGITQLEGNNTRSGIYGLYYDPTFNPPSGAPNSGTTYHIDNNIAAVPQLFFTHSPPDSVCSFGLGVYSPFGLGVSWPQDTGFRAVATEGVVKYIAFNTVAAIKLAPQLSIGAGLSANYGNMMLEQGLRPVGEPLTNFFRFAGDDWAVGYNLGILWQPHEQISIGATFRSSTTFTMDGKTKFEQQPFIQPTRLPARAEFQFPLSAVFGISYRPTPRWNLEFNADYTDWSSFNQVTIHQAGTPPFPVQQDVSVNLKWQASWAYEFGVTRYLDNGWHVSGGYVFNENSVPDDFYTPLAADLDRHFFTVGIGHQARRLDFDIAYQFGYGPAHKVTGSTPSSTPGQFAGQNADGTYRFISHAVLVTMGLHF